MKKIGTIITILCMGLLACPTAFGALQDGLVGYWQFNGDFVDATGNGHDGVSQGTVVVFGPGKLGQAAVFNGLNSPTPGIRVDGNTGWNPSEGTGQLGLSFWIKWEGPNGEYQGVVSKRDTWGIAEMMWSVEVNRDSGIISFFRENSYPWGGGVVPNVGQWEHFAVSFDGTTQRFYHNGVETGNGSFSFGNDTASRVVIGCSDAYNGFKGTIDDVAIWNRALSATEAAELYNNGDGLDMAGNQWKATNPVPADGSKLIPEDVDLTLQWSEPTVVPPKPITMYDVYFGTDKAAVGDPNVLNPLKLGTVTVPAELKWIIAKANLQRDKTYYWRIDAMTDRNEPNIAYGKVWSFETKKSIPVILTNPTDQLVAENASASFSVTVESPSAYTVKWYRVGDNAVMGTANPLVIAAVDKTNWGDKYYCVATNAAGDSLASTAAGAYFRTLVAYYKCDEDVSTNKLVADSSGLKNKHDATAMSTTASVAGLYNGGLSFNGSTDWVNCGTWNPIEATGQMTVSFWSKWGGSNGSWQGFIGKRDDWGAANMMWSLTCHSQNEGRIGIESDGSWPWFGPNEVRVLAVDQWSHVAVTFNGSVAELFINGHRVADPQGFFMNGKTNAAVVFGATGAGPDDAYKGVLDDVQFYNYVLTPTEIGTMASEGLGRPVCPVNHPYDYNQDCFVNLPDLVILLSNWMECNIVPDCQ